MHNHRDRTPAPLATHAAVRGGRRAGPARGSGRRLLRLLALCRPAIGGRRGWRGRSSSAHSATTSRSRGTASPAFPSVSPPRSAVRQSAGRPRAARSPGRAPLCRPRWRRGTCTGSRSARTVRTMRSCISPADTADWRAHRHRLRRRDRPSCQRRAARLHPGAAAARLDAAQRRGAGERRGDRRAGPARNAAHRFQHAARPRVARTARLGAAARHAPADRGSGRDAVIRCRDQGPDADGAVAGRAGGLARCRRRDGAEALRLRAGTAGADRQRHAGARSPTCSPKAPGR